MRVLLNTMAGRADEGFERLSRIARQLLHTPLAMISLFDGQTHHLANDVGLLESPNGRIQMTVIQSLCDRVIEQNAALEIADLQASPLAPDIPAIADPGIGAFLGLPLLSLSGETLGAICVMDHVTREWSKEEVAALSDIGHAVIAEIEGRLYRHRCELSEAATQVSDMRITEILESIDEAFYSIDDRWTLTYVNRRAEQLWHKRRKDLLGRNLIEVFPGFGDSQLYQLHKQALIDRMPVKLQTVWPDFGASIEISIYPDSSGLSVYFRDISEQLTLERELGERDQTLTLAELSAGIGVWDVNLLSGHVRGTAQFFRIMGLEPSDVPVSIEVLRRLRHPEDGDRVVRGFREAVDSGHDSYEMEYRIVRPDGETRWIFGRGRVIRDATSTPLRYSGVDIDITERKQAEEHRLLLVNELNHRVKNILATVQAIASQTFRNSSVEKHIRGAFEGRILALSKAHDLLTAENWRGAGLSDVITETLAPFGINDREGGRISVQGGDIRLSSRKAMAISMALHELATNAAKYGALSNSVGRVTIAWHGEADERLQLRWKETGGPRVREPKSKGFGTHLIERGLPRELQGKVSLDYRPEGLICEIIMPLTSD